MLRQAILTGSLIVEWPGLSARARAGSVGPSRSISVVQHSLQCGVDLRNSKVPRFLLNLRALISCSRKSNSCSFFTTDSLTQMYICSNADNVTKILQNNFLVYKVSFSMIIKQKRKRVKLFLVKILYIGTLPNFRFFKKFIMFPKF